MLSKKKLGLAKIFLRLLIALVHLPCRDSKIMFHEIFLKKIQKWKIKLLFKVPTAKNVNLAKLQSNFKIQNYVMALCFVEHWVVNITQINFLIFFLFFSHHIYLDEPARRKQAINCKQHHCWDKFTSHHTQIHS